MLSSKTLELDHEGFRRTKEKFIVKKLVYVLRITAIVFCYRHHQNFLI